MKGRTATRSPSKRSVIYPVRDAPCPVRTTAGSDITDDVILFRRKGRQGDPAAYLTDDGRSLIDLVAAKAGPDAAGGFASHRFRSDDTMTRALRELGISNEVVDEGILASARGIYGYESYDYRMWSNGHTGYRVAHVEDPSDDTGRNLIVDDESKIPGRVISKGNRIYYNESKAELHGAEFGRDNAPKRDWRFSLAFRGDTSGLTVEEVSRLGYDGRDMEVGDEMSVGPLVIRRVKGDAMDYVSRSGSPRSKAKAPAKKASKPKSKGVRR